MAACCLLLLLLLVLLRWRSCFPPALFPVPPSHFAAAPPHLHPCPRPLCLQAGEDFSFIGRAVPSCFIFLGIRNETAGSGARTTLPACLPACRFMCSNHPPSARLAVRQQQQQQQEQRWGWQAACRLSTHA